MFFATVPLNDLLCFEMMPRENMWHSIVSWIKYFDEETWKTEIISPEEIAHQLFLRIKPEDFWTWINCENLESIPRIFKEFFATVKSFLQEGLTLTSMETPDQEAEQQIAERIYWDTLSIETLVQSIATDPMLCSSEMSFTAKHFQLLMNWYDSVVPNTNQKGKRDNEDQSSLQLFGTPKKTKMDTSISTMHAPILNPIVAASSSKVSVF